MGIEFKFSSDDKDLVKSLEKVTKLVERLKDENKKLKDANKEAAQASKEAFDGGPAAGMLTQITGLISGYASLQGAISLVSREIKNLEEVQDRAADAQNKVADAQIKFLRNLGPVAAAEKDRILQGIRQIAKETGQMESTIYGTASSAAAARGQFTKEDMLEATRQAARLAPESGSEQSATAGGLLDLAKVTGSGNARENLGFMAAIQAQARPESLEAINKALVPAMIGVKGYGGKAGDAGALVSTMTAISGDQEGRMSSTAALQLAKQLEEAFPENNRYEFDKTGRKKLAAKGTGLTNTMDRIRMLQEDSAKRGRFLASASFEEKGRKPVEQILTGGSEASRLLAENATAYPSGEEAIAAGEKYIDFVRSGRLQQGAQLGRQLTAASEGFSVDDFTGANASRIRTGVLDALKKSGATQIYQDVAQKDLQLSSRFGESDASIGIRQLEGRKYELSGADDSLMAQAYRYVTGQSNPAEKNKDSIEKLDELIGVLKQVRDLQKQGGTKNVDAHIE